MRVVQGPEHFGRDAERLLDRELLLAREPLPEGLALDKGHREPELARRLARIVNREDVRMLEPGGQLDLPLEPLGAERGRQLGMEHLQGDGSLVANVLGQVDGGHPAPAELALEPIAIRQTACKLLALVSHSRL